MTDHTIRWLSIGACAFIIIGLGLQAWAQQKPELGYRDTPFLPGSKWRVHDGDRPQPHVVDPGTSSTPDQPGRPPSDAVVLFDGKDLSKWHDGRGKPSGWKVQDGYAEIPPSGTPGGGSLVTRDEFGDCQLHLEFASPAPPRGSGQGRGNSGVMLFGRYEIQVMDSFENPTYPDGQAASVYGQHPPLVNASRRPGEWQSYDIVFTAPRFKDGQVDVPAYVTILHNGVVVQNHAEVLGSVAHRALPKYSPHGEKGPIVLQDHGNPVRFRKIWIRALKGEDQS